MRRDSKNREIENLKGRTKSERLRCSFQIKMSSNFQATENDFHSFFCIFYHGETVVLNGCASAQLET